MLSVCKVMGCVHAGCWYYLHFNQLQFHVHWLEFSRQYDGEWLSVYTVVNSLTTFTYLNFTTQRRHHLLCGYR